MSDSIISLLPVDEYKALLALRQDLHRYPELSWQETRSAARIVKELEVLDLIARTDIAPPGIVVDIGDTGPMVALRADMDALPIHEESDLAFSSVTSNVMHACGHDAHMACLLAIARRFVENPPIKGRVRLIFQPAEEGEGGASRMIQEGVLENPRPIAIFGLHVWSKLATGSIGICDGPIMGSVDRFKIIVKGEGGHGATPQTAIDPIVAASYLVASLQTLLSRRINPLLSAVLTVGSFHAGEAFNIIPETAELTGTIRTLDRETWQQIPKLFTNLVQNQLSAFECEGEIEFHRIINPLINHKEPAALVQEIAKEFISADKVIPLQMLAGEDFASYLEEIPGAFFFVGSGGKNPEKAAPHHSPHFKLDERAFPLAVRILEACARKTLEKM